MRADRFKSSLIEFGSDGPHDLKSIRNASKNHYLRVGGHLCGHRVVECLWHDADPARKAAVRGATTATAVVARNKFSDADAMAVFDKELAEAMLSDADRAAKSSRIVSVYSFRSGKPSELVAGMGKATAAGKPSGVGGRATVCALHARCRTSTPASTA